MCLTQGDGYTLLKKCDRSTAPDKAAKLSIRTHVVLNDSCNTELTDAPWCNRQPLERPDRTPAPTYIRGSRPERQAASPGCGHLCQLGSAAGSVRGQSAGAQAVQRVLDVILQLELLPALLGLRRNKGLSLVVITKT